MIRIKTVFVLGAGASWPYGFPTGPELAESVRIGLSDKWKDRDHVLHPARARLERIFSNHDSLLFAGALARDKPDSIDQFVLPASRAHFAKIAKACIAEVLAPLEGTEVSDPKRINEQWVRYLVKEMSSSYKDPRAPFTANALSVISFNFDRSFEWHMHRELMRYQGWDAATASAALSDTIEIVHVHGQLGPASWLPAPSKAPSRGYGAELTVETLGACIEDVRLATEELKDAPQVERAKQLLKEANIVCFLGFGFLPFNIERLGLKPNLPKEHTRLGTRLSLASGLATKLQSLFHLTLTDCGVLQFLRDSDFLYD